MTTAFDAIESYFILGEDCSMYVVVGPTNCLLKLSSSFPKMSPKDVYVQDLVAITFDFVEKSSI